MSLKNLFPVVLVLIALTAGSQPTIGQSGSCKPFEFNLATTFPIGTNTNAYTSADFNGDGKLDIAAINGEVRTVSVILGDGAGGFGPPTAFPTTLNPYSITSGDFNNDDKPDIVTAAFTENKFAVLLNNGNGGFAAPAIITVAGFGEYMELRSGDFNNDGNDDVVAIQNQSNKSIKIFLGNGQGGLTLASTFTTSAWSIHLDVGNINGDNFPDIVLAIGDPNRVSFVFGQAGNSFSLTPGFNITGFPGAIKIGNLNADSSSDLIMPFGETTQPYFGNGAGGYTPGTGVSNPYFVTPHDVVIADLNGDGINDVASTRDSPYFNGVLVQVLTGRGNGQLQDPVYYVTPNGSTSLLASDVNTDGKVDIVTLQSAYSTTSGKVAVLLNDNNQRLAVAKASMWGGTELSKAYLNSDNQLDLVSAWSSPFNQASEIGTLVNDGARGFGPDLYFDTPGGLNAIETGDFNGDGKADVVSALQTSNATRLWTHLGNGDGSLAAPIAGINWSSNIDNVAVADFNGDGRDDVFIISGGTGTPLLAQPNGSFVAVPSFSISSLINVRPVSGDFNEDGKVDLVTFSSSTMTPWMGVGDGTFTQRTPQPIASFTSAATGDFNGDGNLDVVGLNGGSLSKAYGNGNGDFLGGSSGNVPGTASSVIAGDFNVDGVDDVAFISTSTDGNLVIFPSTTTFPHFALPIFFNVGGLGLKLIAGDFDHDGKTDIGYLTEFLSRGVIYNTSGGKPCISISDNLTITEGDAGTANALFGVTLSEPSAQTVRVNYALNAGTTTVGTDLENVSGRLEIPAGQTTATVSVPIIGDVLDELDERFAVVLSSAVNGVITKEAGLGQINDNDAEPTITIGDVAVTEGILSQQMVFTANLSAPSGKPISFRYSTSDGTATAGSDYNAVTNQQVNIAPGATSVTVNVTSFGDNMFEPNENFFVNLTDAVNVSFADAQAVGTINNDDAVPTLSILGSSFPIEGDTGTVTANVTLQLTNTTYLPVTLNVLTSDGTAIGGRDYVVLEAPVTITPGTQSMQVQVQIIGDAVNELNETFFVNTANVANANTSQTQAQVVILDDDSTQFDLEGDGKADLGIFRPGTGEWWWQRSTDSIVRVSTFGVASDKMVPADYTGDGRTDIAVWRPSTGQWFVLRSENLTFYSVPFGIDGDIPTPADYDNDNRADVAIFRPSTSTWYISQSAGGTRIEQFGAGEDKPVAADYDGDGKADIAIFRPSVGQWWMKRSTAGVLAVTFGGGTDKVVPGDYTGDGRADNAIWRPSTGEWFILRSEDFSFYSFPFGTADDIPSPADFDGDGRVDATVFRPSNGTWYSQRTTAGTLIQQFGSSGDRPVPNAFLP